jgi:hypothetical protein
VTLFRGGGEAKDMVNDDFHMGFASTGHQMIASSLYLERGDLVFRWWFGPFRSVNYSLRRAGQ